MMNGYVTLQLSFKDFEDELSAFDLGEYLTNFSFLYEAALRVSNTVPVESVLVNKEEFLVRTLQALVELRASPESMQLDSRDDPPLSCARISYASPLEIWFMGSASALAIATILAGGEISFLGIHVKLPKSLGQSLKDLRAVFAKSESVDTRSGRAAVAGSAPTSTETATSQPIKPFGKIVLRRQKKPGA